MFSFLSYNAQSVLFSTFLLGMAAGVIGKLRLLEETKLNE